MAHLGDAPRGPGPQEDVRISGLTSADWSDLAGIRLAALKEAPYAFLTNGEDESLWSESDWRGTFETGLWVVATVGEDIVGLARMSDDGGEAPHIQSVWTDPDHRGRGIATALIRWLVARQQGLGATEILLWLIGPNDRARRLYEALGFEPTGESQPLGDSAERIEERLRLPVE